MDMLLFKYSNTFSKADFPPEFIHPDMERQGINYLLHYIMKFYGNI